MLLLLHRSLFLLLTLSCVYNAQRIEITGIWYFDRFGGPHGEIGKSPEFVKANKKDSGFILIFTKDNKLITKQPGGDSSIVNYQVFYNLKQVVIEGDTMKIMLLTPEILELYPKDEKRPALFLKRSKEGKTLMSVP